MIESSCFFSEFSVLLFQESSWGIHSSMDTVFFRRALAVMNCVYTMYVKGALAAIHLSSNAIFQKTTCSYLVFSRLLCFFEIRIPVADIHSINDPFSIIKEQLQPRILVNLMCFCRTGIAARRVTSFTFSVVVSLLQGSTWNEIQKPKSATELVAITFVWEVLC